MERHVRSDLRWRKSAASGQANCLEVACPDEILVRDSKLPEGAPLAFTRDAWRMLLLRQAVSSSFSE
ncbi:MAG: DUF397 domain-containing protein [Streptomycetaceae bacterium]|nr:DUF397 domain-containing protein [Streptomycetaceae bacterium]